MQGLAADLPTKEEAAGNADVAAAELADVALMWQTVEQESRLRRHRRARTSVTSLRSSGDSPHRKRRFASVLHSIMCRNTGCLSTLGLLYSSVLISPRSNICMACMFAMCII
jgi:hypothetical protein